MFRVSRPTVGRSTPKRLRQLLLCSAALCLWPGSPLKAQSNYELAIEAKLAQMKWVEADLQAAQREVAVLNQFLEGYDDKAAQLAAARQQLANADTQLAGIQQNNLVKLTIRMGIETYNTVSDTINLGKSAAGALITTGVSSAVGSVALDKLTSSLTSEGQAALGMDAASLSTPRTVKIAAVAASARAAYPGLDRVQQMLSLSLEAVKAAAYHKDGTELGDTGAILRKNLMVRDEISNALTTLDTLGTDTAAAKDEADSRRPEVEADVTRLTNELNTLNTELETLKVQWSQEEAAARAAANAAATLPPVNLPPPSVTVTREENESDYDYAVRIQAAIVAAALARWEAESPALLAAIATSKNTITEAQTQIEGSVTTNVTHPALAFFVTVYDVNDQIAPETTASYEASIAGYSQLNDWITTVTASSSSLPGLISEVEALSDEYTSLHNHQNELTSLQQMLAACGAGTPSGYATAMTEPGMGQEKAEALAVALEQLRSQLPGALTNAQAQLDQLAAATDAWGAGISAVRTDLDTNLAAAESALAELVSRAAAWETALAAADGLVVGATDGTSGGRYGYYVGNTFATVIRREFSSYVYKNSLLAALATPGTGGLAAARSLKAKYDALVAASPALKDAYDSAYQRFKAAYGRVAAYSGGGLSFPLYSDWSRAAVYSSDNHKVDITSITDQQARLLSLYNTVTYGATTSLSGGEPVVGQPVIYWQGLPRLHQLPDPGMDDPAAFPPHRLLVQKGITLEDGPTWLPLPPESFGANYNAVVFEVLAVQNEAANQYDTTYDSIVFVLFGELGDLHTAYAAAHPTPVITKQPTSSVNSIPAGTTFSTTLSVTATGDFMTYQWYVTRWMNEDYGWDPIDGATSATLTTPGLSETRGFRVVVSNTTGSVTSATALVEVYQVYPTPVFTSADAASGRVGVPFKWNFTSDPVCWISTQGAELPPGLIFNYMTATLEGTPTAAGTYDITVMASNYGSMAQQSFRLTIAVGTLAPFDAWVQQSTTADQRQILAFTRADGTPAGDGISNLLKYAFNLVGTGEGQIASLDTPAHAHLSSIGNVGLPAIGVDGSGHLTIHFVRRKSSTNPGITYTVEFSSTLAADSWAADTNATETTSSIDDTWERVLVTHSSTVGTARFARVRVDLP